MCERCPTSSPRGRFWGEGKGRLRRERSERLWSHGLPKKPVLKSRLQCPSIASLEAETLYREALDCRRRELGDTHPDTLTSINNLALSLYRQHKFDDAETLYREALDCRRRELGDAHSDTLSSISTLASCDLAQ